MAEQTQTYKNHARVVPMYHIGVFFPLLAYFIWTIYRMATVGLTGDTIFAFIVSLALLLMFLSVRQQILTVQDRVIRLEMRLRMREVLHPELAERAAGLPLRQLIALRFASDAELTDLVREVLDGRLVAPKDIKMRVKDWQGDFLRA